MVEELHMGDFIREQLDRLKQRHKAVADAAGMSAANFSSTLTRKTIGDEVLLRVGKAMGIELIAMIRAERDRLMGVELTSAAQEPKPHYGGTGTDLVVHLDQYPEEVQLRILRFVQQQPKKT